MGEDVPIVGDCKGIAVNAQLGEDKYAHTHTLIKLIAIFNGKIFLFVVVLTKLHSKGR